METPIKSTGCWDMKYFQRVEGVEHNPPPASRFIPINLPSRLYSVKGAGFPSIFIRDNIAYLIGPRGLFQIHGKKVILVDKNLTIKSHGWRNAEAVTYVNGTYFLLPREYHDDHDPLLHPLQKHRTNKKESLQIHPMKIRHSQGKYLIKHGSDTLIYQKNQIWQSTTVSYKNADETFHFTPSFQELLKMNLRSIPLSLKRFNNHQLGDDMGLKKFGKMYAKQKSQPLRQSNDLRKWKFVSYLSQCYSPIFSTGETYDILHTVSINDTFPCLLFHRNQYFFYNRANLQFNMRYIQVASSLDLDIWEPYQSIIIDPPFPFEEGYNYYTPSFHTLPDFDCVIGIITRLQTLKGVIEYQILVSEDGIHFSHTSTFHQIDLDRTAELFHLTDKNVFIIPNTLHRKKNKYYVYCYHHVVRQHQKKVSLLELTNPLWGWRSRGEEMMRLKFFPGKITNLQFQLHSDGWCSHSEELTEEQQEDAEKNGLQLEIYRGSLSGFQGTINPPPQLYARLIYFYLEPLEKVNYQLTHHIPSGTKYRGSCWKTILLPKPATHISRVEYGPQCHQGWIFVTYFDGTNEKLVLEDRNHRMLIVSPSLSH